MDNLLCNHLLKAGKALLKAHYNQLVTKILMIYGEFMDMNDGTFFLNLRGEKWIQETH